MYLGTYPYDAPSFFRSAPNDNQAFEECALTVMADSLAGAGCRASGSV